MARAKPDKHTAWLNRLIAAMDRIRTDDDQPAATEVEALIEHLHQQPAKLKRSPDRDAA